MTNYKEYGYEQIEVKWEIKRKIKHIKESIDDFTLTTSDLLLEMLSDGKAMTAAIERIRERRKVKKS